MDVVGGGRLCRGCKKEKGDGKIKIKLLVVAPREEALDGGGKEEPGLGVLFLSKTNSNNKKRNGIDSSSQSNIWVKGVSFPLPFFPVHP